MEARAINDDEKFTEAGQSKKAFTNLNDDSNKRTKNTLKETDPEFNPRTCTYFYNYGYCKFGNSCRYKHFKKRKDCYKHVAKANPILPINLQKNKNIESKNSLQNHNAQTSRQKMQGECFTEEENYESLHSVDLCSNKISNLNLQSSSRRMSSKIYLSNNRPLKNRSKPLCYYFKKGQCYKGDNCKYFHQNKDGLNTAAVQVPSMFRENKEDPLFLPNKVENTNVANENFTADRVTTIFNKALNVYELSSLNMEAVSELRSIEIKQLKKRFPHLAVIKENQIFSVIFQPSDPDWAFDVKSLKLEVDFPEKYPTEKCKITVIQSTEFIPALLIRYLNKAICEWVDKKFEENSASNKTELMFRIFLKWFDKNIEELFITGLKKVKQDLKAKEDGIEFVPVENLFSSSESNIAEELLDKSTIIPNTSQLQEQTAISDDKNLQPLISESNKSSYGGNNGMKIIFCGLELTEGAAAFICTKISATLQCCRCKTSFNIKSVPKKNNSHVCSKCSKNMGFTFDPSTVHQFSSVLGTLHLLDCVAVDINLVECHFLVDCLNCSKQVAVDGIHYGQKHKMWCIFCNEKMLISIGCIKFQSLKITSVPDSKYLPAKKIEKKIKDPVVKEGEPLPNFGTCKHYKKSYRWLRFPCCGRLYPCDECHNEKETDHEMKYASRMICGFCAKEQPYSREKPCHLCSQNLTKKSCSHWEGGKGCRNKIQMSREDKQKYSGVCKTVSKKAQTAKLKKKH